jgi:NADH-quinone oxidoreductase subunit F
MNLIPILQAIQNQYNYLPEEALKYLSEKTDLITPSEIVGVASFYKQFRMQPAGNHSGEDLCGNCLSCERVPALVHDAFRRHFRTICRVTDTDKTG